MTTYLYSDLTGQILQTYCALFYRLGVQRYGLSEVALTRMLRLELEQRGLSVAAEVAIPVYHRQQHVNTCYADLVVEDKVVLEIKKVQRLTDAHRGQLNNYLIHGGWAVGLLLNFGGSRHVCQRCYAPAHDPTRQGDFHEDSMG